MGGRFWWFHDFPRGNDDGDDDEDADEEDEKPPAEDEDEESERPPYALPLFSTTSWSLPLLPSQLTMSFSLRPWRNVAGLQSSFVGTAVDP
jgi:hypothetical protein